MRTFFIILCCLVSAMNAHAGCNGNMPDSTPDSQLTDNGDGTVTDSKTGLMWKKCLEGVAGENCENNAPTSFTWQQAMQQPITVNARGGFAGHTDWRLPNIRELRSIIEEQCSNPAINAARFPNTPSSFVWSGSPCADYSFLAWYVDFSGGVSFIGSRNFSYAVRLVRGGQ